MMTTRFTRLLRSAVCAVLCIAVLFSLTGCGTEDKDKKVQITIPAMYLKENELADLDAYCEANSYIKGRYNKKDDTVTLTMTKFVNELLLVDIGMTVIGAVYKLVESETFPYFKEVVSYEKDFTKITVGVERKAYEADETNSLFPMSVGQTCLMYGTYTVNDNPTCEVTVVDIDTKAVICTETFDNLAPDVQ